MKPAASQFTAHQRRRQCAPRLAPGATYCVPAGSNFVGGGVQRSSTAWTPLRAGATWARTKRNEGAGEHSRQGAQRPRWHAADGVADDGDAASLDDNCVQVRLTNADGIVNWLDTLFDNRIGDARAHCLTIRVDQNDDHDICRTDVPASSRPIRVDNPKGAGTLCLRPYNSTRAAPADDIDVFLTDRFS